MSDTRVVRFRMRRLVPEEAYAVLAVPAEWTDEQVRRFVDDHASAVGDTLSTEDWTPSGGRHVEPERSGAVLDAADYYPGAIVAGNQVYRCHAADEPEADRWIPWNDHEWASDRSSLWRKDGPRPDLIAAAWMPGVGRDLRPVDLGALLDGVTDEPAYDASLGEAKDGLVAIVGALSARIPAYYAAGLVGLRLRCMQEGRKLVRSVLGFRGDELVAIVPVERE